jgi:hypothetical protein
VYCAPATIKAKCRFKSSRCAQPCGRGLSHEWIQDTFNNNEHEIRMVQETLQLPNGTFLPVVITVDARRTFTGED